MKLGKFKVTREVVFNGEKSILADIFSHAFPVKIEWDHNGAATYTAICEWFDDIAYGIEPPLYSFTITKNRHGTTLIEAARTP